MAEPCRLWRLMATVVVQTRVYPTTARVCAAREFARGPARIDNKPGDFEYVKIAA